MIYRRPRHFHIISLGSAFFLDLDIPSSNSRFNNQADPPIHPSCFYTRSHKPLPKSKLINMPVTFVTGSFLPGRFVPNPTQEHVDSGLPEWTLGADGTPPAEPTEHDGDDAEISNDEDDDEDVAGEGYDGDDEDDSDSDDDASDTDNEDDHDDYAEDYEHFLSTLPADNPSTLEETADDGTSASDSYIEDYEDFLSTIEVASSSMPGDTSSAQPPSLETDSGTWTASSDAAATESDGSDEAFNAQVDAEVFIRRPSTPDLSGLALNAHASRHCPRSCTQILDPAFEIHTDSDDQDAEEEEEEEEPPFWESSRPTGPFHIVAHHITLSHDPAPHRVHLPPMTPLPEPFSSYSDWDRGQVSGTSTSVFDEGGFGREFIDEDANAEKAKQDVVDACNQGEVVMEPKLKQDVGG